MSTPVSDRPVANGGRHAAASAAFAELRRVVGLLSEELAGFRRRAIAAESRAKELERELERAQERAAAAEARADAPVAPEQLSPREAALVRENEQLRRRLAAATQRIRVLLERLRFIREQESQ